MMMVNVTTYKVNGQPVDVFHINNDTNGNPRYVVHFLDLGIPSGEYGDPRYRKAGITVYRGRWFGGGYVFTSYSPEQDLKRIVDKIKMINGGKKEERKDD